MGLGKMTLDIGAHAGREFFRQKAVDHDQRGAVACCDFTHGVCCAEERSCDDLPAPRLDDYRIEQVVVGTVARAQYEIIGQGPDGGVRTDDGKVEFRLSW